MTVATFNQTDYTTQNSAEYKANIDADINVLAKLADLFAPHQSNAANMTITVDAGRIQFPGGNQVNKAAQVSGVLNAPTGGNNRIDLVIVDANGDVGVLGGTPAANPSPPALTAGNIAIAQILLATGMNSILNGNITDVRGIPLAGGRSFGFINWNTANANGNQFINCGFPPSLVFFLQGGFSNSSLSIGIDGADGGNNHFVIYNYAGNFSMDQDHSIEATFNANAAQWGVIGSRNATGFNVAWTKAGSPTGSIGVYYCALK